MVKMIFSLLLITESRSGNLELAKKFLNREIAYSRFSTQYDTSLAATEELIRKSDSLNTDFARKEGNGPLEFYAVADSVLDRLGKGHLKSYSIVNSMSRAVNGYIADDYSGLVRKYFNIHPAQYKSIVMVEGKDSPLLRYFLYDSGGGWENELFFRHSSKMNAEIAEWARAAVKAESDPRNDGGRR